MPIYEYKCKSCDDVFEVLILRPSDAPQPCPKCGREDTEKLLSVGASIIGKDCGFDSSACPASGQPCADGPACCSPCGMSGGHCPMSPFK